MKYIKIILPSVLCLLIIYITKMPIWFYPLLFGFIVGLINWKVHRYKPYIGLFLCIISSLVSFWLAIFCVGIFSNFREFILNNTDIMISESIKMYDVFIPPFIVAPLLVFFLFRFIFFFPKTKFSLYVIISSILLLILDFLFFWNYPKKDDYFKMLPYIIWQFIMALSLQLILYQDEIKAVFNKKFGLKMNKK